MSSFKVLFQISGSIAAYKAAHVISRLVQNGCEVQTVASTSALQFIGPATLEGLTGKPVITDTFQRGTMMDHIHLARWADLVILCPATANSINKLAAGIGDDFIGTLFLACERNKPYLIAPAMNEQMLKHPVTQKSLETLKSIGAEILETDTGLLACGEEGYGKLLDPDVILQKILSFKTPKESKGSILITAGGTREPIDSVRSITNTSTGQTASQISQALSAQGFQVTYLKAKNALSSPSAFKTIEFDTFQDLKTALENALRLESFKAVIHLAAVSDFHVENASAEKIESKPSLQIQLKANPKLIDHLREWSKNKDVFIIGFKLTSGASEVERNEAVQKILQKNIVNAVVQNDISEISKNEHHGQIYISEGKKLDFKNKFELSEKLTNLLETL